MDITALNVQYEDIHEGVGPPALTVTESSPMTSEPRTLGRDSPDAAPVVKTDVPVEVFGYLQKQGRRLKGWHQRWFELRGQHMYYYKNSSKKHCLGEIQLEICTSVQPIDAATFGHPFEIITKERTHTMAARTLEDLEKWVDTIRKRMGPKSTSSPKKTAKVKKWDSFKNAFHITRNRSASPQPSNPVPSPSPTPPPSANEVTRHKSFLDKFKIRRDRSNSAERRTVALKSEEKAARPLSEDVSYSQDQKLVAALVDTPTAVSVPNSPLSRKRQMSGPVGRSRSQSRTPVHSSGEVTPRGSTPDRTRKEHPTPPKHTSTPLLLPMEPSPSTSPPNPTFTSPQPSANNTSPSQQKPRKYLTPPSPLASGGEVAIPEILTKPLAWDELKILLESMEESEPLFSDSLPPQEEPWKEKDDPMEQLREFLAVCP